MLKVKVKVNAHAENVMLESLTGSRRMRPGVPMSKKVNKTAIGAFVLGAIALLFAGVIVLGSGKFFTRQHVYITYFDGSVQGLKVGSPVMFRGVKVGTVTDITIEVVDLPNRKLKIPVVFTLEPAKFKGTSAEFQRDPKTIEKAVLENGLRTQLQTMSFVTGQLLLALDFFPGTPANFVGLNKEYPEIPSIHSPLEELRKSLEELPLRQIVGRLDSALDGLDRLVHSIDAKKTSQTIEAAVRDTQTLVRNLDRRIGPMADDISHAARSADATLAETKETLVDVRSEIKGVLASADKTLQTARTAFEQSGQTLSAYSEDSQLVADLHKTLRELSETTRSLRQLFDYLERHPESLLRGKPAAKE